MISGVDRLVRSRHAQLHPDVELRLTEVDHVEVERNAHLAKLYGLAAGGQIIFT